jgi:methionyl-tRNA formyltransferase
VDQARQALRVIFAGTPAVLGPEFARVALQRIHGAGHTLALVLTQPDRPAGRGLKLQASAVKQYAQAHGLPLAQPRSLRLDGKFPEDARACQQAIEAAQADVMVVAAYGLILPQWVLDAMQGVSQGRKKLGCLNIHGSLLPRWRGAAPIHRAIEAGDSHTGITIMQMDAGLDTGAMLLVRSLPIGGQDTTALLHDRLADLGADMVVQALDLAAAGQLQATHQPLQGVSYAHKIEKHEAQIDWALPAQDIVRKVRAFNPFPIANATLQGELLKVWAAEQPGDGAGAGAQHAGLPQWPHGAASPIPGTIMAVAPEGIAVAAMNSIVTITELQRPGGKRQSVASFLNGFELRPGMQFERATPPA